MGDDGEEIMSAYHKIEVIDGSPVVREIILDGGAGEVVKCTKTVKLQKNL